MAKLWNTLVFLAMAACATAQQGFVLKGSVRDKQTNEPLEFASILVSHQKKGAVTDSEGRFTINLDKISKQDTLRVSFLGYEDTLIPLKNIQSNLEIKMSETSYAIGEVTVKPMPPTYYIQQAVEANENYYNKPYYIISYFENNIYENKRLLMGSEAVFKTYYYYDPNNSKKYEGIQPPQMHQLMLFRNKNNFKALKFMSGEFEKQKKKDEKRNKKKSSSKIEFQGEEIDRDSLVLRMEPLYFPINTNVLQFLNEKEFKHFKYVERSSLDRKNLRVIDFQSKKWFPVGDSSSINFASMRGSGTIYIDRSSNAIAKINMDVDVKLSFIVRAALFITAKKLKVNNLKLNVSVEYKPIDGYWYPHAMSFIARGNAEKVNFFSKNEKALFEVSSALAVNAIIKEEVKEIPEEKRFSFRKTNLQNDMGIKWSDVIKVQNSLYD